MIRQRSHGKLSLIPMLYSDTDTTETTVTKKTTYDIQDRICYIHGYIDEHTTKSKECPYSDARGRVNETRIHRGIDKETTMTPEKDILLSTPDGPSSPCIGRQRSQPEKCNSNRCTRQHRNGLPVGRLTLSRLRLSGARS